MITKPVYTREETQAMLKATEALIDAYYGLVSASNHCEDRSEIEEARQGFIRASKAYRHAVPKSMQTENLDGMRRRVSALQKMIL